MPNTSEQRSRSGLCEGVIRREATEAEVLVSVKRAFFYSLDDVLITGFQCINCATLMYWNASNMRWVLNNRWVN